MHVRRSTCRPLPGLFLTLAAAVSAWAAPEELAPGVHLLRGGFVPGSQPDGNTLIFAAPEGLIVVDTGRHPKHTQAIADFAAQARSPVAAILNSHWHLDHIGGNPLLRKAFPGLRVYASTALEGAMKGFLASYRKQLETMLQQDANDPEAQKPWRAELEILDAGAALAPDEAVTAPGERTIAGLRLYFGLETYAVTAGDLWVLDPRSGVMAAGDLITLPAPFLDTACPKRWRQSLETLSKADFKVLVPGHGPAMDRGQVETYRAAFGRLLDCAATDEPKSECVEGWLHDAGDLVPETDQKLARGLVDYYLDNSLRGDAAKTAQLCGE